MYIISSQSLIAQRNNIKATGENSLLKLLLATAGRLAEASAGYRDLTGNRDLVNVHYHVINGNSLGNTPCSLTEVSCSVPQQASFLSNPWKEQFVFHPIEYTSVINQ